MTTLEMTPEDVRKLQETKPDVPVVLKPTLVAVLADGSFRVAANGGLIDRELFRFEFPVICVACREDFAPEVGSKPSTAYMQDKLLHDRRDRLIRNGVTHTVDWFDFDDGTKGDLDEYGLYMALELPDVNSSYGHCMARTRWIDGMVRHELKERGYRHEWVR